MNTPAHVIVGLSLTPNSQQRGIVFVGVIVGSLLPDLPMFGFYAYEKLNGVAEATIWSEHYYDPRWQAFFDVFNSIPLILLGLIGAYAARSPLFIAIFLGMLIHTLCDLPVHHDDGHRHFFPFSDWRYESPVSYWDPNHHGRMFGVVELLIVIAGTVWLSIKYSGVMRLTSIAIGVIQVAFVVFAMWHWGGEF